MLEQIQYRDGNTQLTGLLARPAGPARGAFVIFPTIMNPTPPVERRAQLLADAGFVAMIADFYGQKPGSFDEAVALSEALRSDVDQYRARLTQAIATLRDRDEAAGLTLAAIGYCMGGQAALETARAGENLAMVASFHGLLDTGRRASAERPIKPRILVCHGDADPLAPRANISTFWEEMDAAGANWHFHSYSGVRHGFTDPGSSSRGMAALGYDESADRQSWASFMNLADEIFGEPTRHK